MQTVLVAIESPFKRCKECTCNMDQLSHCGCIRSKVSVLNEVLTDLLKCEIRKFK